MKNKLNFSQLLFLSRNSVNHFISDYYDFHDLMIALPVHIQEFYQMSNMSFHLSEPFLTTDFSEPTQISSISIDGIPLGELHLYHFSFPDFSSLVYYSTSGSLEMIVLDESIFADYTLNNYLTLIYELTSMWIGERSLYAKIQKQQESEQ